MITKKQVETLAKLYQIDGFTIVREYLQLLFLSYLYQKNEGSNIFFKGGTAIRLLFGSPRFSEDLDFSTTYTKKQIVRIIGSLKKKIERELPGLTIMPLYSGKSGIRFRLKYQPVDFKYPLTVRLDFNEIKKAGEITVSPLVTKFPIIIFPMISHLSKKEILAEKIRALATRCKGRDLFDVWFMLEKGILPKAVKISDKNAALRKIKLYPKNKLNRDLAQFLPESQRKITSMLKAKLEEKLNVASTEIGSEKPTVRASFSNCDQ